jgi:KUP system potassium uptake protein
MLHRNMEQRMSLSKAGLSSATMSGNGVSHAAPVTGFLALTIGSVGVIYGDIGTSPLYAFRQALAAASAGGPVTEPAVLGVLSLIFWSLIIMVTLEYVTLLLRMDNKGEGGTLALMAKAQRALPKAAPIIILLGAIATSLFFGDAMITPALSVLSAVEGMQVVAPSLQAFVVPATLVILVGLFLVQSRGTASIATFFGPIMTIWFLTIGIVGAIAIAANPVVLHALSPLHAFRFLFTHGIISLVTLGAVFLSVTGVEALYADLGHFGRRPIQVAWVGMVLPALVLNYFGQGAEVLGNPAAVENPFFLMFPDWTRLPLVVLATAATIIASQAVITGAFSLGRQAIQLGLLPRQEIRHTSEAQAGQIYVPRINFVLLLGVLMLVLLFGSSEALSGAYGIAVSGTIVITFSLAFVVAWKVWGMPVIAAAALIAPFFVLDTAFFVANILKIPQGGWFPVVLGLLVMAVMLTWRQGSRALVEKSRRQEVPLMALIKGLEAHPPPRIAGTAVFLTGDPDSTPTALLHSLKHFKVLHETNVVMTVVTTDTPRVDPNQRVTIEQIGKSFFKMEVRYGFAETPNLPRALAIARREGLDFDIMSTTFFLSRRTLQSSRSSRLATWRNRLFIPLARNADDVSNYFRIPTNRVVEIGTQVTV